MITFFTHLRPMVGEFDGLQRRAMQSWRDAVPGCEVIAYGPDGGMTIRDLFEAGERDAQHDLLCEISSDILLTDRFLPALEVIDGLDAPFVVGQRWDMDAAGNKTLHAPTAADYFVYKRDTLGEVFPFAIGRTAYDNWLVWSAARWELLDIDATEAIDAIHMNHGHPEYEGGRAAMLLSEERKQNLDLALASGMPAGYLISHTRWVMDAAGRISRRERVYA